MTTLKQLTNLDAVTTMKQLKEIKYNCRDPEFAEYEKYFNETKQRIRNQFQDLEDAGFINYIPNDSPGPRIGRRQPEPEPEPDKK